MIIMEVQYTKSARLCTKCHFVKVFRKSGGTSNNIMDNFLFRKKMICSQGVCKVHFTKITIYIKLANGWTGDTAKRKKERTRFLVAAVYCKAQTQQRSQCSGRNSGSIDVDPHTCTE